MIDLQKLAVVLPFFPLEKHIPFFFLLLSCPKKIVKSHLLIAIFSHALMHEAQMLLSLLRFVYDELLCDDFYSCTYPVSLNLIFKFFSKAEFKFLQIFNTENMCSALCLGLSFITTLPKLC